MATDEYYLAMAALDLYLVDDGLPTSKSTSLTFRIQQLGAERDALRAQLDAIAEEGTSELNAAVELRQALATERLKTERLEQDIYALHTGLGQMGQERDDAVKERDALRAEIAQAKQQHEEYRAYARGEFAANEDALTALRAEREGLVAALKWAREELHCYAGNDGKDRTEVDGFAFGHRCVNCDENVDRNMELRKAIDAALKETP